MAEAVSVVQPNEVKTTNGKFAMWVFLASEIMFFAGLIGTYIVYRMAHPEMFEPVLDTNNPMHAYVPVALNWKIATVNTFLLITSSFTMVLAVDAAKKMMESKVKFFLNLTAVLGVAFCCLKGYEYYLKFDHHVWPGTGIFYACYFTMTGVHTLHVIAGIIPLFAMAAMCKRGKYTNDGGNAIELLGLYWHFVDVVWILIFPMLYLVKWNV